MGILSDGKINLHIWHIFCTFAHNLICFICTCMTEEDKKKIAWLSAQEVDGFNKDLFRKDACGAWIMWDKYGDTDSIYGWQIDHICPRKMLSALGFSLDQIDHPKNLRALQHQNNASKGDDYPSYMAVITAEERKNVEKRIGRTINASKQIDLKKLFNL